VPFAEFLDSCELLLMPPPVPKEVHPFLVVRSLLKCLNSAVKVLVEALLAFLITFVHDSLLAQLLLIREKVTEHLG
jgi:hypothetical protein